MELRRVNAKQYKNTQFYINGCKIGCYFCKLLIFNVYCGAYGTGAVNVKVEGQNAEVYTLKAEIGKAPQKIRVETRYEWTAERQDINDKYPGFADWVADPTANWY